MKNTISKHTLKNLKGYRSVIKSLIYDVFSISRKENDRRRFRLMLSLIL
jgi:hypothetical protein